jgi:hypothetical protein
VVRSLEDITGSLGVQIHRIIRADPGVANVSRVQQFSVPQYPLTGKWQLVFGVNRKGPLHVILPFPTFRFCHFPQNHAHVYALGMIFISPIVTSQAQSQSPEFLCALVVLTLMFICFS